MTTLALEVARFRMPSGVAIIVTTDGSNYFGQLGQATATVIGPCSRDEINNWVDALVHGEAAL